MDGNCYKPKENTEVWNFIKRQVHERYMERQTRLVLNWGSRKPNKEPEWTKQHCFRWLSEYTEKQMHVKLKYIEIKIKLNKYVEKMKLELI